MITAAAQSGMDAVSKWFPPLTNREVLTILAACAIAIIVGLILILVPFRRRLASWAASQGCEVVKVESVSVSRGLWNTAWRVTVRDPSGATHVAVVKLVGWLPFPARLEAEWQGGGGDAS